MPGAKSQYLPEESGSPVKEGTDKVGVARRKAPRGRRERRMVGCWFWYRHQPGREWKVGLTQVMS